MILICGDVGCSAIISAVRCRSSATSLWNANIDNGYHRSIFYKKRDLSEHYTPFSDISDFISVPT